MSTQTNPGGYRSTDPIYNQCDCGEHVRAGRICSGCGQRSGDWHSTQQRDAASNYATVAENIAYAEERRASEVPPHVHEVSVRSTLRAAGLEGGR